MQQKKTNKWVKRMAAGLLVCLLALVLAFAGCAPQGPYVVSVRPGSDGEVIVEYSDGSITTIETEQSAEPVGVKELYEYYQELYGELSYEEFLRMFISADEGLTDTVINRAALSCLRVYSEARETDEEVEGGKDVTISIGSGSIYRMEEEYTYILTNYHVALCETANEDNDGPAPGIGRKLTAYIYGSESVPQKNTEVKDELGYPTYDYGKYAIDCEYLGGTVSLDVAVLRAKTADILAVNPQARAIEWADEYHIGETAFTIGNENGKEMTATRGILSVEREDVDLEIGGVTRTYSLLRMDTPIYGGNSGGILFNAEGKAIGVCNSGRTNMDNINFAVPLATAQNAAENIIDHFSEGSGGAVSVYNVKLGVTVEENNAVFSFDESAGHGHVYADVTVLEVQAGSIAAAAGAQAGDIIRAVVVDGEEYTLRRGYEIADILLQVRAGSSLSLVLERDGERIEGRNYTVAATDLQVVE